MKSDVYLAGLIGMVLGELLVIAAIVCLPMGMYYLDRWLAYWGA